MQNLYVGAVVCGIVGNFLGQVAFNAAALSGRGAALGARRLLSSQIARRTGGLLRNALVYGAQQGRHYAHAAVSYAARIGQSPIGRKVFFPVRQTAQYFSGRIGISGRLGEVVSAGQHYSVGILFRTYQRAQSLALASPVTALRGVIRGINVDIVNANLFSTQQIQTTTQMEEIGALAARLAGMHPSVDFNLGILVMERSLLP